MEGNPVVEPQTEAIHSAQETEASELRINSQSYSEEAMAVGRRETAKGTQADKLEPYPMTFKCKNLMTDIPEDLDLISQEMPAASRPTKRRRLTKGGTLVLKEPQARDCSLEEEGNISSPRNKTEVFDGEGDVNLQPQHPMVSQLHGQL